MAEVKFIVIFSTHGQSNGACHYSREIWPKSNKREVMCGTDQAKVSRIEALSGYQLCTAAFEAEGLDLLSYIRSELPTWDGQTKI